MTKTENTIGNKAKTLAGITIYPANSVTAFLGFKTITEFKDKVLLAGKIKCYDINGKQYFSANQIADYLNSVEI